MSIQATGMKEAPFAVALLAGLAVVITASR